MDDSKQHLNYAWQGQTQPEFPGGFVSNHSLQGTPEFAYGLADWWEAGFYLPFAVNSAGEFLSDGVEEFAACSWSRTRLNAASSTASILS